MSKQHWLLRYGWCSYLYSRCSVWFACMSTQPSALHRAEVCALSKIPGFTRIPWEDLIPLNHPSALNTQVFPQPKIKRSKFKVSCRPVDWSSTPNPLSIESQVEVLSERAEKMKWCPIMHKAHLLIKIQIFQEYWYIITHKPISLCTC